MISVSFGRALRDRSFLFDAAYTPLNHGSYGAFPRAIRGRQRDLQDLTEAGSDPFIRFKIPKLLLESREAVAPLLGVSSREVVFVPNATTGINTVLRNLNFDNGDIIVYFNTAYGACEKTILHICETTQAECVRIDLVFPIDDVELVDRFRNTAAQLAETGKRVRIAMFDTVVTFPGARLPWEALVQACKDLNALSLIDGAHGIGHIDLRDLGRIAPDFFTSNCYKWLYVPRGCAVLYVPTRNQHLMRTTLPTSHGFKPLQGADMPTQAAQEPRTEDPLGDLFWWAATIDMSPYLCISEALKFRSDVCGGEDRIRQHCFELAREGGKLVAERLGTEVMDNSTATMSQCCFTMVRLPLVFGGSGGALQHDAEDEKSTKSAALSPEDGPGTVKWIMEKLMTEYNTWIPGKFYCGQAWMRISAQTYLSIEDFAWAAEILSGLCKRVDLGEKS